jgi:hypothetical protein
MKTIKNSVKLTILFLCILVSANAQEILVANRTEIRGSENHNNTTTVANTKIAFEFLASSQLQSVDNITDDMVEDHFLGSQIAKKMYLFNENYSYKVLLSPGNSATKTIFRKPEIYSSVKKIERYLKDCVKKHNLDNSIASSEYDNVLNIALNILDENTDKFEERLKLAAGNPAELLNIYLYEVKLDNMN